MLKRTTMDKEFYQNLVDAHCSEELTEECITLADEGNDKQILVRLKEQRKRLLEGIHEQQKALDCLDYLMFQMEEAKR